MNVVRGVACIPGTSRSIVMLPRFVTTWQDLSSFVTALTARYGEMLPFYCVLLRLLRVWNDLHARPDTVRGVLSRFDTVLTATYGDEM